MDLLDDLSIGPHDDNPGQLVKLRFAGECNSGPIIGQCNRPLLQSVGRDLPLLVRRGCGYKDLVASHKGGLGRLIVPGRVSAGEELGSGKNRDGASHGFLLVLCPQGMQPYRNYSPVIAMMVFCGKLGSATRVFTETDVDIEPVPNDHRTNIVGF